MSDKELPSATTAVSALIGVLSEFVLLLRGRRGGDSAHWADWLEKAGREISDGDFHGVERLWSAYGGMGSLNDLQTTDEEARLIDRAWELANLIRHNAEIRYRYCLLAAMSDNGEIMPRHCPTGDRQLCIKAAALGAPAKSVNRPPRAAKIGPTSP